MANIFPQPLYSGDVIPLQLSFFEADGTTPKPLTGNTIGLTVKTQPSNTDDAQGIYSQDVVGDATGIINFQITPLNAGNYYLDIKNWITGQTPPQRTTIIGTTQFTILQSVTARAVPT